MSGGATLVVDRTTLSVEASRLTGREIIERYIEELGRRYSHRKPDEYALYQKVRGEQPVRLLLDERVTIPKGAVLRFMTLPLDQTEGVQ